MQSCSGKVGFYIGVLVSLCAAMLAMTAAQAATNVDSAVQLTGQKSKGKRGGTQKANSKKTKGKNAVVTPIGQTDPGWGETPQQRTERLTRECKGKPNGGACEGFGGS